MKLAQDSMDQLFEDLRQREKLTVKAICRRYGISPSTVRRAQQKVRTASPPKNGTGARNRT